MKVPRSVVLASLVALCLVLTGTAARAAAGAADPTFGIGGMVVTDYNGPAPTDALLQPDGKIVVVTGFDNDPSATEAFGVLRYQSNGALDTSFGVGGRATTAFTNFINSANDAVLQPDGKIVVAGETESADGTLSEFAIARFTASGTLDSSFGVGGEVTTNFVGVQPGGVRNPATSVLLQADGRILVGGSASQCPRRCGGTKTALARYNPDGSLDNTFGSGGIVSVTAVSAATTLAQDTAGDIFALNGASIAEFSPTGALQPQVTPSPIAVASSAGFQVSPTVFQADGTYLLSTGAADGTSGYQHDTDAKVVRYQPTGVVDPGFTNPPFDFGVENPNSTDLGQAIARQPNGQVVIAGYRSFNGTTAFTLARLNAGGSLDTTFGTGGTLTANLAGGGQASAVIIQPDGKILVIGQGFASGAVTLVLARYLGQ
jgi:uncharacterized delta-60 repeat protein